jgi:hypothetical protein
VHCISLWTRGCAPENREKRMNDENSTDSSSLDYYSTEKLWWN